MELTQHSKERIKERVGVGKSEKKIERAAAIALERGIKHSETKGALRRYLDGQFLEYNNGNNMRIHASQIWIFNGDRLITVKPVPARFQRNFNDYIKK